MPIDPNTITWDDAPAPQQRGPVYGPGPKAPAAPTPFQVEDQHIQRTNAERSAIEFEQKQREWNATHNPDGSKKPEAASGGGKNIPEVSARGIQGNIATLAQIDAALAALNGRPQSIGPGTGFFGDTVTQFNDPDGTNTRASIGKIGAVTIHDLSGAAVSASEAPRFQPFVPTVTDRPEVARAKLEKFREELRRQIDEQDAYYSPANGYMPYTTPGMDAYRQSDKQVQDAAPPPAFGGQQTLMNQEGQIAGVSHNNGDEQLTVASGDTRREDNPALAGVRDEYIRRLGSGASTGELIQWARSAGINDPEAYRSIAEQVKFRDANPGVAISEYDTTQLDDQVVPLTATEKGAFNSADSAPGAFFMSAGDAATGFNMDSLVGMTGGNAERARLGMQEVSDRHAPASLLGTVTGGTLASLAAGGGAGALGLKAGQAALAGDTAYGAFAGAGGTDYAADGSEATLGDRATGAFKGTLASLLGSGVGTAVTRGASNIGNAAVGTMRSADIPMTIGQQVGQSGRIGAAVKGIEDRVAGLPVVGDIVNARRAEGYRKFNSKSFDKALEPIGGAVGDKVGGDAVEEAAQQVQGAFGKALAGKVAQADQRLGRDLTTASTQTLAIPRVGQEVGDNIQDILAPYMNGPQLSGEAMQTISQELRKLKAGYKTKEPALANRIGKAIDATEDAIFGLFRRQTPEVMPAYNAAKQAYRRVSILADAVNAADNQTDNVFTPAQLNRADKANAKKYEGSLSAAAGPRQFRDFAKAAQEVLPNKVPDSGTAGRILVPAAAAGLVGADSYTSDGVNGGTMTLAAILAGAYTKAGQRVLTRGAVKNKAAQRAITAAAGSSAAALTTQ